MNQVVFDGDGRSLGAIGDAKLGQASADVTSHRGRADRQLLPDLAVAQSLSNQGENLPFARGEIVALISRTVFWPVSGP